MKAVVLGPFDGKIYDAGGSQTRILARGPEQEIAIIDGAVPAGFPGPKLHRHRQMSDIFYVLEGELTFELDDERLTLGPGSFVLVPPGVAHTFSNTGTAPARFLNIYQPAGLEQYLEQALERMAAGKPWSPAEMAEIAAGFDFEPITPAP